MLQLQQNHDEKFLHLCAKTGNRRSILQDCFYDCFFVEEMDDIESNTLQWKSPSLVSISPGTWTGAETYFHPHKHSTHNAFSVVTNEINYLQYDWNEKRVNAREDSEEFVRYYFRMSESSTVESSRVYTFTDLMTKIGGLYVLIFGVGRTIGLAFNFLNIRRFHSLNATVEIVN